jgi:hypothetical protein
MSTGYTGNATHDATVTAAEGVRQTAVAAAAGNQASVRTADIAFHRSVVTSCIANNSSSGLQPSMQALRELGVTGQ